MSSFLLPSSYPAQRQTMKHSHPSCGTLNACALGSFAEILLGPFSAPVFESTSEFSFGSPESYIVQFFEFVCKVLKAKGDLAKLFHRFKIIERQSGSSKTGASLAKSLRGGICSVCYLRLIKDHRSTKWTIPLTT